MTADQQHAATTEFNETLAAGFASGNFDEIGGFYTDTSSLMPPRGTLLTGRAPISAFWLGVRNRFSGAVFTTTSAKSFGDDMLRETGTYVMTAKDEQGAPAQGKYLFVWQRVDGEWQIESSIWNRNAEPGGAGRRAGAQGGQGRGQGAPQGGGQGGGGGQGRGGGYRQGGQNPGAQGAGPQGAGPQGAGAQGGGYRQGGGQGRRGGIAGGGGIGGSGGRPSFQGGGGGGRRQGGGGQGQGGARGPGGQGRQGGYGGGGNLYEGNAGLYTNLKE